MVMHGPVCFQTHFFLSFHLFFTWYLFTDDIDLPLIPDFPHDHARSRTYRWGEDGIAGVSDSHGLQNISFVFWNEQEYEIPSFSLTHFSETAF
jgi:hypothetical protein